MTLLFSFDRCEAFVLFQLNNNNFHHCFFCKNTGTDGDQNRDIKEKDMQTLDQSADIDNNIRYELNEKGFCAKVTQDHNDVKINFNELERSIYRPARRGFAF